MSQRVEGGCQSVNEKPLPVRGGAFVCNPNRSKAQSRRASLTQVSSAPGSGRPSA